MTRLFLCNDMVQCKTRATVRRQTHCRGGVIHVVYNMTSCEGPTLLLSRDGDLDLDTGLQADTCLGCTLDFVQNEKLRGKTKTYNLLDDLA